MKSMTKLVALALLLGACVAPAEAAVTANSVITAQTPNRGIVQFLQGTDTAGTYKTLYTGGANGSICKALVENNNDPSATHLITVQVVNGGVSYGGVAVTTAVNDGFANGTAPKNFITTTLWPGLPLDSDGNPFILLASGDTLKATFATAITASDLINLYVVCYDY